jgi:hypothetical protein
MVLETCECCGKELVEDENELTDKDELTDENEECNCDGCILQRTN